MKRRNLTPEPKAKRVQKTDEDWETLIVKSLTADVSDEDQKGGWGCLSRTNELFRIASLEKTKVPPRVVRKLERSGVIELDEDGFYKTKGNVKRRPSRARQAARPRRSNSRRRALA